MSSVLWWHFCSLWHPPVTYARLIGTKQSLRNASTSLSLVTENWQTPECAQGDCDFTSHSISNILLLWIKSSQSKSVSACACLFGKEMLFRGILFVIVVEQYDIKWAQYWSSAVSTLRFLTSTCFSFWPSSFNIRPAEKLYFIYMHKYDVLHVFVTYEYCMYSIIPYVSWYVYLRACMWVNWFLFTWGGSLFLLLPTPTLFKRVNAVFLSHIPSWAQHLEKLKVPLYQIILLSLLFIAVHFVLSFQWQTSKLSSPLPSAFSICRDLICCPCFTRGLNSEDGDEGYEPDNCRHQRTSPLKPGLGLCPTVSLPGTLPGIVVWISVSCLHVSISLFLRHE